MSLGGKGLIMYGSDPMHSVFGNNTLTTINIVICFDRLPPPTPGELSSSSKEVTPLSKFENDNLFSYFLLSGASKISVAFFPCSKQNLISHTLLLPSSRNVGTLE
jgi:hypothetical protein